MIFSFTSFTCKKKQKLILNQIQFKNYTIKPQNSPPPENPNKQGGSVTTSSPLPFCTGGEKQRHLRSNKIATTISFSFPFLSSVPSLLSLSGLSLVLPLHDG
jgi:hypothetical protein